MTNNTKNKGYFMKTIGNPWKSIETAPKDGTPILIVTPKEQWPVLIAEWCYGHWYVHGNDICGEMCGIDPDPTHWMERPNIP